MGSEAHDLFTPSEFKLVLRGKTKILLGVGVARKIARSTIIGFQTEGIHLTIHQATKDFEKWLGKQTPLNSAHLALKHQRMAEGPHAFLRATYYRWAQLWPQVCRHLNRAPKIIAVGDLHADNFGIWRDSEGRLVWGINDFDEAYPLPYTNDLVRLATSVALAYEAGELRVKPKHACEAILEGYANGLKAGGEPFVLAEKQSWLAEIALARLRDPARFWRKLESFPKFNGVLPPGVREALESLLPAADMDFTIVQRVSGLGGLGRQRFVALADWYGGKVAREVKAVAPSASVWARRAKHNGVIHCQTLLGRSIRCRDPFVRLHGRWLVRRLSPNCSRIDLETLPRHREEYRMLQSMGWETANVHLNEAKAATLILRDLTKRPARWLRQASKVMAQATELDWREWRNGHKR